MDLSNWVFSSILISKTLLISICDHILEKKAKPDLSF